MAIPLRDLIPIGDPRGGSPKTPPRGIPKREFQRSEYDNMTREELAVSLRDYVDMRFQGVQQATDLAREELSMRLEKLNELREQVTTDRGLFITRDVYEARHNNLASELEALTHKVGAISTLNQAWAKVIAVFLIVGQVLTPIILYFLMHK